MKVLVQTLPRRIAMGAVVMLALTGCTPRGEQATQPAATAGPAASAVGAPRVERLQLTASATGHVHEIDIFRPSTPPPPGGFPVVVLLDGNRVSHVIRAALTSGQRIRAVYVTVGYRGDQAHAVRERALDYTPAVEPGIRSPDPLDATRQNGGAHDFRLFLEQYVKPEVSRRVPVDWGDSTLWGHSYAGLFVLTAMLDEPSAFARYVVADPSLWWRDAFVYQRLMRESPGAPVQLTLLEANAELEPASHARDPAQVAHRQRLQAALPAGAHERIALRWNAAHRYYPEHHHGSLFERSLGELLGAPR